MWLPAGMGFQVKDRAAPRSRSQNALGALRYSRGQCGWVTADRETAEDVSESSWGSGLCRSLKATRRSLAAILRDMGTTGDFGAVGWHHLTNLLKTAIWLKYSELTLTGKDGMRKQRSSRRFSATHMRDGDGLNQKASGVCVCVCGGVSWIYFEGRNGKCF